MIKKYVLVASYYIAWAFNNIQLDSTIAALSSLVVDLAVGHCFDQRDVDRQWRNGEVGRQGKTPLDEFLLHFGELGLEGRASFPERRGQEVAYVKDVGIEVRWKFTSTLRDFVQTAITELFGKGL